MNSASMPKYEKLSLLLFHSPKILEEWLLKRVIICPHDLQCLSITCFTCYSFCTAKPRSKYACYPYFTSRGHWGPERLRSGGKIWTYRLCLQNPSSLLFAISFCKPSQGLEYFQALPFPHSCLSPPVHPKWGFPVANFLLGGGRDCLLPPPREASGTWLW